MKTYKIFLAMLVGTIFLSSCEDDDKSPVLTDINPSTLNSIPLQSAVLTEPGKGQDPLLCTFTWSATQFFLDGSDVYTSAGKVDYALEVAKAGDEFANAHILASTANLRADIMVKELNNFLISKLEAVPYENFDAEFRIVTTYGEGLPKTEYSTNTLKMSITPYKPAEEMPRIYLIGDMNGWSNTNTDFRMFRNSSSDEDKEYVYIGRIAANTYYKFIPESSLGSWKVYYDGGNGTIILGESEGGAFHNALEGYKKITIDIEAMTVDIEDYDITGATDYAQVWLAGAFNGWPEGGTDLGKLTKTAYDPHVWTATLDLETVEYGVKFNAGTWSERWCPPTPTDVPYGKADHNPTGHDNNIDLGAKTGTYFIQLNDLTGHYIVEIQE